MRDGFLSVCAATPRLRVADVGYNVDELSRCMDEACGHGTKLVVFPELCITGYTCGDLFYQDALLAEAARGLLFLVEKSKGMDALFFVGLPFRHAGRLYNVAAAFSNGVLLGLVPKTNLPNYDEFYEQRHFTAGMEEPERTLVGDVETFIGSRMLFCTPALPEAVIACEICEDLWVPSPPSTNHAQNGATIIVNLSASNELIGKSGYRRQLVSTQSARLYAAYVYASAGICESTQDVVYSGHRLIAEGGTILAEGERFTNGLTYAEVDTGALAVRRMKMNTFGKGTGGYRRVGFDLAVSETGLRRRYSPTPFVPEDGEHLKERCEEIFTIQAAGLGKRLSHTGSRCAVVGISGGLDSTLALLVTVRAFEMLGLDKSGIMAVTMPGFGTTDRTYDNAVAMIDALGVTKREIPIAAAVRQHFADIGQDEGRHDVTYENSQARERTQILMDIANQQNGLVVGTGDLSELALGWATYNGDHMSMYAVNASIPKTLVRHLVRYYADALCGAGGTLRDVLYDVLETPVSPELLPPGEDGGIAQKTEDLVGPYELHDFFLYYMMRFAFSPAKIFRLARLAFEGSYDAETILSWERTFYRRFFAQQFKRSCLPDGPKVGTVALSPRGDWRMPSDASWSVWREDLEKIQP